MNESRAMHKSQVHYTWFYFYLKRNNWIQETSSHNIPYYALESILRPGNAKTVGQWLPGTLCRDLNKRKEFLGLTEIFVLIEMLVTQFYACIRINRVTRLTVECCSLYKLYLNNPTLKKGTSQSWGDGSMGKSTCSVSLRA